jgi:beta-aspartyl-peptidase (threonine type)
MRFLLFLGALMMAGTAHAEDWKLMIHGGAGIIDRSNLSVEKEKEIRASLDRALVAGSAILDKGGTALDAVEAAVRTLEDDPDFNAGRGAVLTWDGQVELDASIMDGRTRSAGAVTGVMETRNPISLARAVMEKSPHVFLSGPGADAFAREQGLPQVPNAYFIIPERQEQLVEMKARKLTAADVEFKYGTVGAVALDSAGHVAAATSTGGMTGKRWDRIGDSPVIGAGTYADDRGCAVSSTGAGEFFIRVGVAHEICARIRMKGESAQQAADAVIAEVGSLGGSGGVIVVTPKGEAVHSLNTPGMYRGTASAQGRSVAIFAKE